METKNKGDFVLKVFRWLCYDKYRTIEPEGKSGGLAIFWKDNLDLDFLFEDKHLIDLQISHGSKRWFVSCVYDNPVASLRSLLWERISTFGLKRKEAWYMIGDFNEILSNAEKSRGPLRLISSFRPFKDMFTDCGMHELGSTGNSFTWGCIRNYQWIQCKLDRCLEIQLGLQCFLILINGFWRN